MDRDSAVIVIKDRLKRSNDTAIESKIISEMQIVQRYVLEENPFLPWFLLSEFLSVETIADDRRLAVPANVGSDNKNFLMEYEDGALWRVDSSLTSGRKLLIKDDYDALFGRYTGSGKPTHYSLDGEYFRLFPTPDAVYDMVTRCYLTDRVLSTNIENNWLKYASDLLIAATAEVVARSYLRDKVAADIQAALVMSAWDRLKKKDTARKMANYEASMGDL